MRTTPCLVLLLAAACGDAKDAAPAAPAAPATPAGSAAAPAPAAPAASVARTQAKGFSVVLPAGWETRDLPAKNILLGAAKGTTAADLRSMVVMQLPEPIPIDTAAACKALGDNQAEAIKGTHQQAQIVDGPTGKACQIMMKRASHAELLTFMPAGQGPPYYVLCDFVADELDAPGECKSILASWKLDDSPSAR